MRTISRQISLANSYSLLAGIQGIRDSFLPAVTYVWVVALMESAGRYRWPSNCGFSFPGRACLASSMFPLVLLSLTLPCLGVLNCVPSGPWSCHVGWHPLFAITYWSLADSICLLLQMWHQGCPVSESHPLPLGHNQHKPMVTAFSFGESIWILQTGHCKNFCGFFFFSCCQVDTVS